MLSAIIEVMLWLAIFRTLPSPQLGGYGIEHYLSYAICATFVSRICSNWSYEFRMIEEIETGGINATLSRPVTFFESYLSQFLGYKFMTALLSWWVPFLVVSVFALPINWLKIPQVILTLSLYLVLLHLISFSVATLAFHLTRVGSFTVAKNLGFWVLSGELIPLDLIPEPYRHYFVAAPFANAVYIPVGLLTGRVTDEIWLRGIYSILAGYVVFGLIAHHAWKKGIARYAGTGA